MSKNTPQKRGAKEAGVAAPSSTPQQNPAPRIVQENATAAAAAAAAASSSHPAIMMDVESDPASVISDGHSGTGRGRGDSAQIAADLAAARSLQAEFQAQHSPILSAGGSTGGGAAAAAPSSSSGSVQRKLFTVPKTPVKSPRATKLSSSMKKASPAAAAASTASPAASRSVPIVTIASLIRSSSAAHVADYASERKEYEKKQLKTFKATGVVRCKILGFEQVDEEFHITYGACCAPTGNEQKNTSGSGSAPSSAGASNVNLSAFARFGQVAASGVNESSTVTRERSCGTKIQNQTYDLQQVQFMQAAGSVTIVHLPDDDIVDDSDVPPVYWVCNRLPANGGAHAVKHYFSPKMMFKLKVVDLTATADDPEPATLVMTVFDDTAKVLVGMDAAAFNDLYDRDEAGKAECIAKCQSLVGKEMLFRGEVDIKERVPHAEPGNEKQIWQNATLHVPSTNYSQDALDPLQLIVGETLLRTSCLTEATAEALLGDRVTDPSIQTESAPASLGSMTPAAAVRTPSGNWVRLPPGQEQRLPILAMGDCGIMSILCDLLCPVAHDQVAFEERLTRLRTIPKVDEDLPDRTSPDNTTLSQMLSPTRTFPDWQGSKDGISFRHLLLEFRCAHLPVNAETNQWLLRGPNPEGAVPYQRPNPRYAAAIGYFWRIVRYLRSTLMYHRIFRLDMKVTDYEANCARGDVAPYRLTNAADRQRFFKYMATTSASLTTESMFMLAAMLGCRLTIRQGPDQAFWLEDVSTDSIAAVCSMWYRKHAACGNSILPINVNDWGRHFDAVIPPVPFTIRDPSERIDDQGLQDEFEDTQPDYQAEDAHHVVHTIDLGLDEHARRDIMIPTQASTSSLPEQTHSVSSLGAASESESSSRRNPQSEATALFRLYKMISDSELSVARVPAPRPAPLPRAVVSSGATTTRPATGRRFTDAEKTTLTEALHLGVTHLSSHAPSHADLAARLSAVPGRPPCSAERVRQWFQKNKRQTAGAHAALHADSSGEEVSPDDDDYNISGGGRQGQRVRKAQIKQQAESEPVPLPPDSESTAARRGASQQSRRNFTSEEKAVLMQKFAAGVTSKKIHEKIHLELAETFTKNNEPCSKAQIVRWFESQRQHARIASGAPSRVQAKNGQLSAAPPPGPGPVPSGTDGVQFSSEVLGLELVPALPSVNAASEGDAATNPTQVAPTPGRSKRARSKRNFTAGELATLRSEVVHGGLTHSMVDRIEEVAGRFKDCAPETVASWLQRPQNKRSAILGEPGRAQPRAFLPNEVKLLQRALAEGVTHAEEFSVMHRTLAMEIQALQGSRRCPIVAVERWFRDQAGEGHSASESQQRPLIGQDCKILRSFSRSERDYLEQLYSEYGFDVVHSPQHVRLCNDIAVQFSQYETRVCAGAQVLRWFQRRQRTRAKTQGVRPTAARLLTALPPFHEAELPPHVNDLDGRNKQSERIGNSRVLRSDVAESVNHFWETSGLDQYREILSDSARPTSESDHPLASAERAAKLSALLNRPVTDEVRSKAIGEYNEYMDPDTPMLYCAVCGVYELANVASPLRPKKGFGVLAGTLHHTLFLQPAISVKDTLYNTPIRLTDEQVEEYLRIPARYRACYCVLPIQKDASCEHSTMHPEHPQDFDYYHLNGDLASTDANQRTMVRICSMCDKALKRPGFAARLNRITSAPLSERSASATQATAAGTRSRRRDIPLDQPSEGDSASDSSEPSKSRSDEDDAAGIADPQVPFMSIASGCDYGRPCKLNLPQLSLMEKQLIACYRVFANIVKLVPPHRMGRSSRQSAYSGHTIVFPHDGPLVCAAQLPNLAGIHDAVSIMFVGTNGQWTQTRGSLLNKFSSIFQVRRSVVQTWLQALKQVNPLYEHINIAAADDPTWDRVDRLGQEILDRAVIADDPVTLSIEMQTTSDVSGGRTAAIQSALSDVDRPSDPSDGVGLPAVFLSCDTTTFTVSHTGPHFMPLDAAADGGPQADQSVSESDDPAAPPAAAMENNVPETVRAEIRGRRQILESVKEVVQQAQKKDQSASNRPETDPPTAPIRVPLTTNTPLNEYTENDILLIGSFPHLFFLGRRLPFVGSASTNHRQKLLRQHDQRFSRDHQLVFLLFNQLQRHAVARSIAARVRSGSDRIEAFHRMVNEPEFEKKLEAAIAQPNSQHAERLVAKILPLISITGSAVPFSAMQRRFALPQLIAFTHQFGLASFFLTISPSDLDQPLTIRLAVPNGEHHLDKSQRVLEFPMPDLAERGRILADNPVAAAEVFARIMEVVTKTLLRLAPYRRTSAFKARPTPLLPLHEREPGIFGVVRSHYFVFETQGRGTLHTHGVVWTDLPPTLLQDLAEFPECVRILGDAIDQVCVAQLPPAVHQKRREEKAGQRPSERNTLSMTLSSTPELESGRYGLCSFSQRWIDGPYTYSKRYQDIAASVQVHDTHVNTCRKGNAGKYGCRMSMPQACRSEPTGPVQLSARHTDDGKLEVTGTDKITGKAEHHRRSQSEKNLFAGSPYDVLPPRDTRHLVWELNRPSPEDGNVVTFCPALTSTVGCNTAVYPLGSVQQSQATSFYMLKYMTKDSTALTNSLAALHEAKRHIVAYPSVAANSGDPVRTAQHLMNRLLNNISGKSEISAEMAAAALLGMPSTMSSHGTAFAFIHPAIQAVKHVRQRTSAATRIWNQNFTHNESNERRNSESKTSDDSSGEEYEVVASEISSDEPGDGDDDLLDFLRAAEGAHRGDGITVTTTIRSDDDADQEEIEALLNFTPEQRAEQEATFRRIRDESLKLQGDVEEDVNITIGADIPDETLRVYHDQTNNKFVAVPQHLHYHFRGQALAHLCYWEYVAMIQIELRPAQHQRSQESASSESSASETQSDDDSGDSHTADSSSSLSQTVEDAKSTPRVSKTQAESDLRSRRHVTIAGDVAKPRGPRGPYNTGLILPFDSRHPLAATHHQRLRAVYLIPMLAGKGCPVYPGLLASSRTGDTSLGAVRARITAARMYAEYMLTLFAPWKIPPAGTAAGTGDIIGPDCALNYKQFCAMFRAYRNSADRNLRCRTEVMTNISFGLRTSFRTKKIMSMWRSRAVKRWGSRDTENPASRVRCIDDGPDGLEVDRSDRTEHDALRAAQLIEAMRAEARTDDITQARSAKALLEQQQQAAMLRSYTTTLEQLFPVPQASPSGSEIDHDQRPLAVSDQAQGARSERSDSQMDAVVQVRSAEEVQDILRHIRGDPISNDPSDSGRDDHLQAALGPAAASSSRAHGVRDPTQPMQVSPDQMNAQQRRALQICQKWLTDKASYDAAPALHPSPSPLMLLIHGGAGSGKSTFATALVRTTGYSAGPGRGDHNDIDGERRQRHSRVLCAAPTGVAASLLINGFTLHTLLAIPTERGTFGGTTPFGPLLATKLTEVQERLYGSEILLIDECSMVGSTMLGKVDRRLREVTGADVPFGGKGIVLMGDFFQLSAVGETSLPTAARICEETIVPAHTAYQLASLAMMGGQLFRQFRIIRFTQQMRINSDDVQHAALIEAFQQVDQSAESPITRQLLQQLERKYLTPVAIQQDPTWLHASIVVPTNEQRFLMTPYAMKHFAAQRGVPILRWRYPLPHQAVLTDNEIKILYERKPQLWAYFVPDAPVFITKNIAPTKGLANGTSARLHSISWDDEAYVEEVRLMQRHHRPGEVIDVRLPVSVNVEIPLSQLNHTSWTPTDKQTLVPGRAVLPLKQNCPTKIRMGKGYACPSFVLQQFSYELAFVVTFHKCQGRTMPKVILDLNKQPLAGTVGNVSYSGLYVGLSRVRKGVDVAIFPPVSYPGVGDRHAGAAGSLDHLLDLLPNHEFLSWWSGFDFETGQWSNERVKQATAHAIAAEKRRRKISRKARITTGRESDSRESQAQGAQANNASVFAAIHLQLTVSDSSLRPTSNHTAAAASGSASGPTTHAHHPTTGPSLGISMHMDLDGLVDMQGSLQLQENEWNAQGNDGVPEEQDEHMGVDDPDPQGPQNDLQWMPPAHVPPAVPIPTPNPNQNRNFPVDEDGDAIMTYLTR